jgi:branched-chain amino acid transport system substrate-binding protein
VRFALCYDLSKSYTFVTPQIAQAAKDYADILNAKGGLEGKQIEILVQDHGNEPQRGIECYEKMKRDGVMVIDTLSTPVSRAVLPRAMKDGTILLQSLVGRGDAIDGDVFKWVFPIGPTYWGQAANNIQYIKDQAKGNVKGKKVAFLYIDYPFGQEPIGVLKSIAAKEGIDLQLFPHPLPGNDQAGAWSQIRRFNPDWIIHWGFSNMHVVASREMKRNGISMDKYIAVNWLNEVDITNIGADVAKGLKRGTNVLGGTGHPLIQQILKDLYDKGKGNGDRKNQRRLLQHRPGDVLGGLRRRTPGDQERRLAADRREDEEGLREPAQLRRQRPDGADDRDGQGPRRRRQDPHRDVGRRQVGATDRLDRGLHRHRTFSLRLIRCLNEGRGLRWQRFN